MCVCVTSTKKMNAGVVFVLYEGRFCTSLGIFFFVCFLLFLILCHLMAAVIQLNNVHISMHAGSCNNYSCI